MAPPVQRTPGGPWSMKQIVAASGVTLAVARNLARQGLIEPTALTEVDVVVLRAGTALMGAPRPRGQSRAESEAVVRARDETALDLVRTLITERESDALVFLMIFPAEAVVARTIGRLGLALEERPGQEAVVVPIGSWIAEILPVSPKAPVSRAAGTAWVPVVPRTRRTPKARATTPETIPPVEVKVAPKVATMRTGQPRKARAARGEMKVQPTVTPPEVEATPDAATSPVDGKRVWWRGKRGRPHPAPGL